MKKKKIYILLLSLFYIFSSGITQAGNQQKSKTTVVGKIEALVILIEFADRDEYFSKAEVDNFFNQVGYNKYDDNGSVHDYWYAVSQGRVSVHANVEGYYRAPKNFDYYDTEDGGHTSELLDSALNWLDKQGFDFSTLTVDENNNIKGLSFQFVGNSGAKGLWGHSSSHVRSFDGVNTKSYQISELGTSEMHLGGICHEQGHMLFGWPDSYDIDSSNGGSSGCGKFDLMGAGNSDNTGAPSSNPMPPNPYFRYLAGWNDLIPLNNFPNDTTLKIIANNWNTYVYRNPDRAGEMFIVEAREKPYRNVDMPGEGVLIWHIDSVISNNANQQHTESQHYKVSVVQADNKYQLESGANTGDANDYFKAGTYSTVTYNHTRWWNSAYSGLVLRNIGSVADTMTMQYGSYNATDIGIKSSKTNGGTISPYGLRYFTKNSDQKFTATPLDEFDIYNCSVDNDSLGEISSYEFTNIEAPHSIMFSFARKSVRLKDTSTGANYSYYEGSWTSMPDFSSLTPVQTGTLRLLTISIPNGASDNYGVRYTGYIYAPQDGEYTFYMTADDGCSLSIGSTEIVSNQCQPETSGSIILREGYHPVTIDFFEAQISQSMSIYWSGPTFPKKKLSYLTIGTEDNTAVKKISNSNVRVWSDNTNFIFSCPDYNIIHADIYNITGMLIESKTLTISNGKATLPNSDYKNGVYLVKLTGQNNDLIENQKVFVQH
ncbi:MAG: M6 family metalloprotease domain-containing protein [Paludibacter sp.]|nr:M6 family metalloprotease domain-containing protein [Paludibacter sp.]